MDDELTGAQNCPTFAAPTAQQAWVADEYTSPIHPYRGHVRRGYAVAGVIAALLAGAGLVALYQYELTTGTDAPSDPGIMAGPSSTITGIPETPQVNIPTPAFVIPTQTAGHLVDPEPAPTAVRDLDQDYLRIMQEDGFNITDPATAIRVGHLVCQNLALTHNLYQTHLWVHNTLGVKEPNAEEVTTAAAAVLCPEIPG